jgi:hypothetical protein
MEQWRIAQLLTDEPGHVSGSIDQLIGEWPLREALLGITPKATLAFGGLGYLAFRALRAFHQQRRRLRAQNDFWKDILPNSYVRDYAHVYGDAPARKFDLIRGNVLPIQVRKAIFRAVWPSVAAATDRAFERFEDLEAFASRWARFLQERSMVPTLHALAVELGSRISFLSALPHDRRRLLLPLFGGIGDDLACRHLLNTAPMRRYHLAVRRPQHEARIFHLSDIDAFNEIRCQKDSLVRSIDSIEVTDATLDSTLQYEIWKTKSARSAKLEPLLTPHVSSQRDTAFLHDAILVIVSRAMDPFLPEDTWIFSAQPLHVLGTVSVELFWNPNLLLRKAGSKFAEQARRAIEESMGIGFEAVLAVKRRRTSPRDRSPRVFTDTPILRNALVTVAAAPRPLSRVRAS